MNQKVTGPRGPRRSRLRDWRHWLVWLAATAIVTVGVIVTVAWGPDTAEAVGVWVGAGCVLAAAGVASKRVEETGARVASAVGESRQRTRRPSRRALSYARDIYDRVDQIMQVELVGLPAGPELHEARRPLDRASFYLLIPRASASSPGLYKDDIDRACGNIVRSAPRPTRAEVSEMLVASGVEAALAGGNRLQAWAKMLHDKVPAVAEREGTPLYEVAAKMIGTSQG